MAMTSSVSSVQVRVGSDTCYGWSCRMIPAANVDSVWGTVVDWGMEQMGDYGAFWYQMAIGSGYYAPHYDTPDDGSAMYKMLTKYSGLFMLEHSVACCVVVRWKGVPCVSHETLSCKQINNGSKLQSCVL